MISITEKLLEERVISISGEIDDIMIHQPLGGISGQASDIVIVSEHITNLRQRINRILAKACGQTVKKIAADSERDHWLTSEEALKYGIIDKVIVNRKENT